MTFSSLGKRRLERGGTDCIFYLKGLVVTMKPKLLKGTQ